MNPSHAALVPTTPVRDRTVVELSHPLGRLRGLTEAMRAAGLQPSTMLTAVELAAHADRDGIAYRSARGLARDLGRHAGAVSRDLTALRRAGLVEVVADHQARPHRCGYRFPLMSMYRR